MRREMTPAIIPHDRIQPTHMVEVAAKRGVIGQVQGEFYGCNQGWCRNVAEPIARHAGDINHERDATAGPHVHGCAATGHAGEGVSHRMREPDRVFGHARA